MGLLATALAPVVSYIALDNGWGTLGTGCLTGLLIGFLMPPLSAYTYKIQNGMNLYNMGFACGLTAMVLVPLMSSLGADPTTQYHWAEGTTGQRGMTASSEAPWGSSAPRWSFWACSSGEGRRAPPGRATAGCSSPAAGPPATICACSAPARCSSTRV